MGWLDCDSGVIVAPSSRAGSGKRTEEVVHVWIVWIFVVSAVLLGVVLLALGRGDGLAEDELDDVIVDLPEDRALVASDVETLRLPLALRGYRMSEVDRLLDRLSVELATRDAQIRQLQGGDPGRTTR